MIVRTREMPIIHVSANIFELSARKFFRKKGLLSVGGGGGICSCSVFCCALLCVHSGFAIILIGRETLVALVSLSSCFKYISCCTLKWKVRSNVAEIDMLNMSSGLA